MFLPVRVQEKGIKPTRCVGHLYTTVVLKFHQPQSHLGSKLKQMAANGTIFSFYDWVIFHCIYVPHLLYPFNCWWIFRLLPCPGSVISAAMNIGVYVHPDVNYLVRLKMVKIVCFILYIFYHNKKKNILNRQLVPRLGGFLFSESEIAQLCLTLCNPMDYSLPGSSIRGIFQARVLEWVAISFSRGSSWPRDWTWVSQIAGRHFTISGTREALLI